MCYCSFLWYELFNLLFNVMNYMWLWVLLEAIVRLATLVLFSISAVYISQY